MKELKYWAVMFGGSHYGNLRTVAEAEAVAKQIQGDYKAHLYPYYDEPHYSTNIAAAWLVVEKLRKTWAIELHSREGVWNCLVEEGDEVTAHYIATKEAETAPLAICLAALAAVGYHVDRKEPNS